MIYLILCREHKRNSREDKVPKVFFSKSDELIKLITKKLHGKRISVTKDMNF